MLRSWTQSGTHNRSERRAIFARLSQVLFPFSSPVSVHVLILPSWYPTSEAPLQGIYFAEQAQCLSQHGMDVGVIYPEHQSLRRLSWTTVRHKHFQTEWTDEYGIPTLRRYGWNVWSRFPPGTRCRVRSAVQLARRYVDRHGVPDLIHAQSGRWAGAAAARIGARDSIPFVLTEHFSGFQRDAIFPWRWPLIREGYRNAAVVTAVSTSLKETLVAKGLESAPNISLSPNLAPLSQFSPPPSPRPSPPPFRFVTIARLTLQKNVDGLLAAFAQASLPPSTQLDIVGEGPERTSLEAQSEQLGIANRVRFRGCLDRSSVQAVLRAAHAFVLPSHYETFGVVLLEAMATGLPVVTTARGGPEDIVTPDTGLLIPTHDTDALANALQALRRQRSAFDAGTIRDYVRTQYGPKPFVRRTRALYQRAL